MGDWREAARADVRGLKPHFAAKHNWNPQVTETADAMDVVVTLTGKRLGDTAYTLRLRYLADWQLAGRREAFVDAADHAADGVGHWPPATAQIRGLNPTHQPPCICLRGVFGYHSVLHPDQRPDGTTLLGFLLELQAVIAE